MEKGGLKQILVIDLSQENKLLRKLNNHVLYHQFHWCENLFFTVAKIQIFTYIIYTKFWIMIIKLQITHNFNIHLQKENMQNEIVAGTINVWLHKTGKEHTCKLNNEQNRKNK